VPQLLGDLVHVDDLVRAHQQQAEHLPGLRALERAGTGIRPHFQ